MANFVYNRGKGRPVEMVENSDTFVMLLLDGTAAKATLEDLTDVAAVLATGGVSECDFTNYTRQTLTNVVVTTDNTGNVQYITFDPVTIANAGGATNNDILEALIYKQNTNDSDHLPLTQNDCVITTTGQDLQINCPTTGFFRAA